jgi:xanthine dehydrogenase YagR molybdenum-binding subunit
LASVKEPIVTLGTRSRDRGGWFFPPLVGGLAVGKYVAGAVHVFEVEVDTRLGRTKVLRSYTGVGAGKIMTPTLARSQVLGGVTQAISYALYEERRLDPRSGLLLTGGLEDYRIAGLGDVGEAEVHFEERGFDNAGAGGVGLAELITLSPAPALANAVYAATGFRPRELPIRPDRVLAGMVKT